MRYLGLDIGTVRIGAAISDEIGIIASPLCVFSAAVPFESLAADLLRVCKENDIGRLVVGLPLSIQGGSRGRSARLAKMMGRRLGAALGLPVTFVDERFTTAEADRALIEGNVQRKKRKDTVDKVAAALLLQTYLDKRANER